MDIFCDKLETAIRQKYCNNDKNYFNYNSYLKHRENPELAYIDRIVGKNGLELEFVKNQTESLCAKAVEQNIYSYVFIRDNEIRKKLQKNVIEKDIALLGSIEDQTKELCEIALRKDGLALQFIFENPEQYYDIAIEKTPLAIQFVKNQTSRLCRKAVRKNGLAIQYVKDKELSVCLLAIRQNPLSLKFIENQSEELVKEILENVNNWLFTNEQICQIVDGINNQTLEICKFFIGICPEALKYMRYQNEELCILAIKEYYQKLDIKKCFKNYDNWEILDDYNLYVSEKKLSEKISIIPEFTDEISTEIPCKIKKEYTQFKSISVKTNNEDVMVNYNKMIDERKGKHDIKKETNIVDWIKIWTPNIYELLLTHNHFFFDRIENPTEELCKFVVKKNGMMLQKIKNQTEEICLIAVEQNGLALQFLKEQTAKICDIAIKQNPSALKFMTKILKTPEICLYCVQKDPLLLEYVDDQTESFSDICEIIIEKCRTNGNYDAFKFIKNKTHNICKLAVEYNGMLLEYVPKEIKELKDNELCEIAVRNEGLALKFVDDQTDKICELAVQNNGMALQFVKDQTDKICELAVQQNYNAFDFVELPTKKLKELAAEKKKNSKQSKDILLEEKDDYDDYDEILLNKCKSQNNINNEYQIIT